MCWVRGFLPSFCGRLLLSLADVNSRISFTWYCVWTFSSSCPFLFVPFFICVHPSIFILCSISVSFCRAIAQSHKLQLFHSIFGVSPSASFLLWEVTLLTLFFLPAVCQFCSNLLCVADRQKCQPYLGLRALCHQFNIAVQIQYTWIVQLLLMNQNLTLQRAGN